MKTFSPKLGHEIAVDFIVDGVCKIDSDEMSHRFVNEICNLGYACDACPHNKP